MAFKGKIKRKLLFVTFMVIRVWQEWRWEGFHVWVSWRDEENWEGQGGACQGDAADGGPGWRWVIIEMKRPALINTYFSFRNLSFEEFEAIMQA